MMIQWTLASQSQKKGGRTFQSLVMPPTPELQADSNMGCHHASQPRKVGVAIA